MYIKSFEYNSNTWKLDTIYLNQLNLIVGKNAAGKSRTLKALVDVAKLIKGESVVEIFPHRCTIVFADSDNKELQYSYKWSGKEIIMEAMKVEGQEVIFRDAKHAKLKGVEINPPTNKLIIQTQRDTSKFPEFETVIGWAEHTRGFSFSELTSLHSFSISSMFSDSIVFDEMYEKIGDDGEIFIKNAMCSLGYNINRINKLKVKDFNIIYLHEDGVDIPLISSSLSNGMLRVFYMLAYMLYISTNEGAKTFLVDDLGEGLDFSRSSRLSKIMFDYCEAHGIQLIVTSNDSFLLNAIDLNNWIILRRTGKKVASYSNTTHPDMFVKFRKMGLNNFDMLSTDFMDRFISEENK